MRQPSRGVLGEEGTADAADLVVAHVEVEALQAADLRARCAVRDLSLEVALILRIATVRKNNLL